MKKNKEIIILLLIVAFGAFLRFYNLGEPSCFNDELETLRVAKYSTISEMINQGIIPDVHPPGFQVIMFYVVHYIGDSEFWLRFPMALIGILSIPMIYVLGKYLYSSREGLISALMVTVLWAPLFYSQEARSHSMIFLLSIMTTLYWLKILNEYSQDKNPKTTWIVIYIVFAIISIYTHYLIMFYIFLQGLFTLVYFLRSPKYLLRFFIIFIIIIISYLPWLPYAIQHFQNSPSWITKPSIFAFGYFLAFLFNLSPYVLFIAVTSYIFLLVYAIKNKHFYKNQFFMSQDLFLLLWLVVPFFIIFIKSLISKPTLTNYGLLLSGPAAYILFARGITTLKLKEKWQNLVAILIFLFITWQIIFDFNYYGEPYKDKVVIFGKSIKKRTKQMFREAAQYVKSYDSKYPNSIIAGYAWFPDYFNYYFNQIGYDRTVDIHVLDAKDTTKFQNIKIQFPEEEYIWVLRGHKEYDSNYFDWMKDNFKLIHYEPMIGADVWLYKIPK
ncbi:MAG: glycosyltransferase family 39 protein [bacterium]